MNVYVGNRLPSTYQEVEYIQSSGNGDNTGQYINTGLSIQNGVSLKVEIDFQYLNNTTAERDIFAYYVDSTNDYILGFKGGFFGVLNSGKNGTLPTTRTPNTYSTNTRYKVIAEGTTKNSSKSPFLFASNGGNDNLGDWDISAKLYYCKVRQNNVLVRDFIPCYRKSDSVIGLYDLVNNQFYTNSGTGTFSKGSDVTTLNELKNAYIGEVYEYSYDFRNKSVAGMQSDGWQFSTTSTITIDSNGISHPTTSGLLRFAKQIPDISYAKKITYYITVISPSSGTCYAFCRMGKTLPSGNGTVSNYTGIYASLEQNNYQLEKNGTYTTGSTFTPRYSATFQIKTEIDLVNKTIKWTLGNTVNTSTLTDTEVNSIKTFRYIQPGCEATGMYVRDLLLTVE